MDKQTNKIYTKIYDKIVKILGNTTLELDKIP